MTVNVSLFEQPALNVLQGSSYQDASCEKASDSFFSLKPLRCISKKFLFR